MFVVTSVPEGAAVTTDLDLPQSKIEKDEDGNVTARFYGCQPTPCGFKLPRRSDFNVMVVKPDYQPSTHAVYKDRNKKQAKANENAAAATVAAGTIYGGVSAASVSSAGGFAAVATPVAAMASVGVIVGVPTAGIFTGIDFATGAMIDLNPNPLNVALKPEVSSTETRALIDAFDRSRTRGDE